MLAKKQQTKNQKTCFKTYVEIELRCISRTVFFKTSFTFSTSFFSRSFFYILRTAFLKTSFSLSTPFIFFSKARTSSFKASKSLSRTLNLSQMLSWLSRRSLISWFLFSSNLDRLMLINSPSFLSSDLNDSRASLIWNWTSLLSVPLNQQRL